jgi:Na+/H+ antiporter NhaD/arsenite permease-like protein
MAPWVIVVMIVITPMLVFMFRKELVNSSVDRARIDKLDENSYLKDKVLLKKSLFVLGAVMVAFILHTALHLEPSIVAMLGAGLLVGISGLKPKDYAMDVEWGTLVFFAGLFIMVGALVKTGALGEFAAFLKDQVGDQASLAAMVLLFVSAILSGIVDNIPYVASMSPVVTELAANVSDKHGDVLWWSLAFGADFGGNATIIGASANVVAIGLAHKAGIKISFWQFAKYGIPVTLVSVLLVAPYILIRYF